MSSYLESYGTIDSRRLCDVCNYYGHWSYKCNFAPQDPTTPYNARWEDPSFGQRYEDYQGDVYDQSFLPTEFYQPSQYHVDENEASVSKKLDAMIVLLKESEEVRQENRQRQEEHSKWFEQQMFQFHVPVEQIVEDEDILEYCSRSEGLCLAKQSPVADEQYLEPEAESLLFDKQEHVPEPSKPIYTELDYILEFDDSSEDDFSETDESDVVDREHVHIKSTQENMEVDEKGGFGDFNGMEMNKEIEEATNCLPSVEPMTNLANEELFDIPLNHSAYAFSLPISSELQYSWDQDTVNPSRKGWDWSFDDVSWLYQKVYGDFTGKSLHGLVYWEFYHLPFKIKDTSDWFTRKAVMETCKCEENKSFTLLSFGDDRLDAPDIITWYKDRGKHHS